jgi:2-hydroxy-6-oxonona-2,4-dienedioate hydrolase
MEAIMRRRLVLGIAALIVVAVGAVAATFLRDTRRAYDRVLGKGEIITSPYGDMEYSEGGAGPAVLVIHGGGGGYDQGEILVETVLGDDFHWIAPSRFGYLRSRLPEGATWDDQANAFAYLLDQLGIETVAVVALSQGGPSALLLAALHPERVSSLTCLSCGVAPSTSEDQAEANKKGDLLKTVFGHNYLYWPMSRYGPAPMSA